MFFKKKVFEKSQKIERYEQVRRDVAEFRRTEGWGKLTPVQRRLIIQSLFNGIRSDIATVDIYNYNLKHSLLRRKSKRKETAPEFLNERESNRDKEIPYYYVNRDNDWIRCVHAAFCVENSLPYEYTKIARIFTLSRLKEFLEGNYTQVDSFEQLRSQFQTGNFPYVVNIQEVVYPETKEEQEEEKNYVNTLHSFVVLGVVNGRYVIWEKPEKGVIAKKTTLRDVYDRYVKIAKRINMKLKWGVRPMNLKKMV